MADEEKTAGGGEKLPAETKPGAGDPQPGAGNGTGEDIEALRAELKKANKEAAERRKKIEEYERAEAERKQAEMSELERTQARLKELEEGQESAKRALLETVAQYEIRLALSKVPNLAEGAAEVADKLLVRGEIEFDDEGRPKNVDALVKGLVKRYPFLVRTEAAKAAPNINAGATGKAEGGVPDEAKLKELRGRFRF